MEEDIPYHVDKMLHANEINELENVSTLHDFDGDPKEFEGEIREEEDD